jgi:NAD(P)-dependent dehydrogenase (short-subunit alcohol dehydrogenase family)
MDHGGEPPARVALVTGGSRGIGLATAQRLAAAGHQVAVTWRSEPPPEDSGLLAVRCDVTDTEQVDAAFTQVEDELGPVGIVVANAGITRDQLTVRMADADFADVVDTNLAGGFRVARRALRPMMKARWGRLVFVSSVVASTGGPGQANYAAAKAGLVGLARSLAREFGSRSITANVVAPGPIDTEMFGAVDEARRDAVVAAVPLARTGTVTEVAATIAFLCSEDAGYVTGAVLPVDGGLGMGT